MKKEIKGFLMGSITTALLTTTLFTASAQSIYRTIDATYSNIKLYVDGKLTVPKDAKGNTVEPFVSDGTTYLPVRAVAQTLGKEVSWDESSNSIYIGKADNTIKEVTVSTAEELVKAIGSNKKIILKPGVYDLTSAEGKGSNDQGVSWEKVYDGIELNINGVSNLTIEGQGKEKTELRVTPRYANIMSFNNCTNINIKNVYAGHTPAEYECDAGVLAFNSCTNVSVSGSELFGCGSMGLRLDNVKNFTCDNTIINHCSLRAVLINSSESVKFTKTNMVDLEAFGNIIDVSASDVIFEECMISNNKNFGWNVVDLSENSQVSYSDVTFNKCKIINNSRSTGKEANATVHMFKTLGDGLIRGTIKVINTEITGNTCDRLTDSEKNVTFENCKIQNNSWQK